MNNSLADSKFHEDLRDKARSIVSYKMHRTVFILANVLIWLICIFLYYAFKVTWVWAIFPTAIWTVILVFHHLWVFKWNKDRVEKEYQKLLSKIEKKQFSEPEATGFDQQNNENQ
jgi:L-asparagine transporter-like permease